MTVSFQAFRDRYPTASITSEVLLVQSDRFVVKVTIETAAAGCATGLAAHSAIEVAEDRARQRALVALGWLPEAVPQVSMPAVNGTAALSTAPTAPTPAAPVVSDREPVAPSPLSQSAPVSVDLSASPLPTRKSASLATQVVAQSAVTVPSPPPLPTTAAATAASPPTAPTAAPLAEPPPAPQPPEPAPLPVPDPEPDPDPPPLPAPEPIDLGALPAPINLSDVIAQTDIELRRLGWSVETGREYLEKTYQKRSRHELSEEELIQFLCHLESL